MSLMIQRGRSGTRGLSRLVILFVFAFVYYLLLFVVVNEPTSDSEVYLH